MSKLIGRQVSVDIRYRVELEVDGMPTWPSPALQVLELP